MPAPYKLPDFFCIIMHHYNHYFINNKITIGGLGVDSGGGSASSH